VQLPRQSLGTFELAELDLKCDGLEEEAGEEEAGLVGDQIQGKSGRMWARAERRWEATVRNGHADLRLAVSCWNNWNLVSAKSFTDLAHTSMTMAQ
jgi:hypothetical protein